MNKIIVSAAIVLLSLPIAAHAEYEQVDMTVFGMDCAPCAHAIHVSMKGIQGVNTVDVNLNTGLVAVKLAPGNAASMHQFNEAVEKNGFTHKDANIIAKGKLTGSASAPYLEISGTQDRYALVPASAPANISALLGKAVIVSALLPQAPKGKVSDTLKYSSISEAQ